MKLKINDSIPEAKIYILKDGNPKEQSIKETLGSTKVLLFGLPGAYTSTCSKFHLPGYVKNVKKLKAKGINKIFCISVNDPYVMNSWGKEHNTEGKILMIGDPYLNFTNSIGAEVDKSEKGLGIRSNRYTMLVENEIIKKFEVEKETATCELSAAENFLSKI